MTVEEVLAFERAWLNRPQSDGRKADAITRTFDLGETAYYQRLRAVLGEREALAVDPMTTRILLERMRRRQRTRSARNAG